MAGLLFFGGASAGSELDGGVKGVIRVACCALREFGMTLWKIRNRNFASGNPAAYFRVHGIRFPDCDYKS